MKTRQEISDAIRSIDEMADNYPGMTYEEGAVEALLWVLGEIPNEEFAKIGDPDYYVDNN